MIIGDKDKNNAHLAAKLDDELNLAAKAQKVIKEIKNYMPSPPSAPG